LSTPKSKPWLIIGAALVLALVAGARLYLTMRGDPTQTNSLGMAFVEVPAGTSRMGSPDDEVGRGDDEQAHDVTLSRPFHLGTREVTQEQFERVMGFNPSVFRKPGAPVVNVSWEEAAEFCRKLSELPAEREAGRHYRLPTEAEWEHACRQGEGLPGMRGSVWEWCADWYDGDYYTRSPQADPQGPAYGAKRVARGGPGPDHAKGRCADRLGVPPDVRLGMGLRVVMEVAAR
jgi:formylglycine-generating enzyme required for sulfatase activity